MHNVTQLIRNSTFWLVLGTWALAGIGWLSMADQHAALTRQLDEMQREQRAWVYVSGVQMTAPASFEANGIGMTFAYSLRNSGKNPATNVAINTEAKNNQRPTPEWYRRVCAMKTGFETTVFPGSESSGLSYTTEVLKKDLVAIPDPPNRNLVLPITLTACVVYQDAVTGKWGHTPFAIDIRMKSGLLHEGDAPTLSDMLVRWLPFQAIPPD